MAWKRQTDEFTCENDDVAMSVHLEPFWFSAINRISHSGVRSVLPPTSPRRPDTGSQWPISYRAAADVLGSYAGRGPGVQWFGFGGAELESMDDDRLSLRLLGSEDPVARCGLLTFQLTGARLEINVALRPDAGVAETSLAFDKDDGDAFFGFGERFDHWDHAGETVDGWTADSPFSDDHRHRWTYWPLPYTVTAEGPGMVLDTTARTWFRLGSERTNVWTASAAQRALRATVFLEATPRRTVEAFTELFGRPPVPPNWALGVWKTMLGGESRLLAEVDRMEQEQLPMDAVWIYDQTEQDTNSGWASAMGYPEGAYEDMPRLVGELHGKGYKVLGYLNPQFLSRTPRFVEGAQRGFFLRDSSGAAYLLPCPDPGGSDGPGTGIGALLDPWNPEATAWWSDMLARLLTKTGYDGWMHDFGEFTPLDAFNYQGDTGAELRNNYPVAYQRAGVEAVAPHKSDAVLFMRSGYLGSTPLCPAVWPGDQHTEWDTERGLRGAVRAALSLSLAGVNTFGPDIAGFFGTDEPQHNEQSDELWIRWCQFGALCPLMRDHLGSKRRPGVEPVDLWHNAATIDTWRRYAQLHIALYPYLKALALEAHLTGIASIRSLLLEFSDDPTARHIDDEYLLGPGLLVAPVLNDRARSRSVYFPVGQWSSFYDGTCFSGPAWHDVDAPLGRIPLFVRSGIPVPLWRSIRWPGNSVGADPTSSNEPLEIRWCPSSQSGSEAINLTDGTILRDISDASRPCLRVQAPPDGAPRYVLLHLADDVGFTHLEVGMNNRVSEQPLIPAALERWWDAPAFEALVPLGPGSTANLSLVTRS